MRDWVTFLGENVHALGRRRINAYVVRYVKIGYYMYFDATQPARGTKARMLSARYYGYTDQCVQFFYHMHGRHIGTLNVYTVASIQPRNYGAT